MNPQSIKGPEPKVFSVDVSTINTIFLQNDRRSLCRRWFILILICFSSIGIYYCRDIFGVLHDSLKNQFIFLDPSFEYYFGLLYSVYSLPNIILPFIGGILIMKFGIHKMYLIFGFLVFFGQTVCVYGSKENSMNIIIFGRILMGLGGESINVAKNSMILKWFYKSETALPLGISISFMRIGSIFSDIFSPILISDHKNNTNALWMGSLICLLSLFSIIILIVFDYKEDLREVENEISLIKNETFDCATFSYLKDLNILFWISSIICMILYATFITFKYNSGGFLTNIIFKHINRKKEAQQLSGIYMSIPFGISFFLIPICGYFIDKYSHSHYLVLISSLMSIISYFIFFIFDPLYGFILLGITYSLFSISTWASIISVVDKSQIALACGIKNSMQNFGYSSFPMIFALIIMKTKNYFLTLWFFISFSAFSLVLVIILLVIMNKKRDTMNFIELKEEDGNKNT